MVFCNNFHSTRNASIMSSISPVSITFCEDESHILSTPFAALFTSLLVAGTVIVQSSCRMFICVHVKSVCIPPK
jgi:hypothetical protein